MYHRNRPHPTDITGTERNPWATYLDHPTPYPDVNALLAVLLPNVRAILGDRLIGLYLDGSLATGGFDQDSDIDFVAVTRSPVDDNDFLALSEMHDRITTLDSPFAFELEGFYVPASALRRDDPRAIRCPNLERGKGERLKWVQLDTWWAVHRHVLYEHGVVVSGPAPRKLVDRVTPDELRDAMAPLLAEWLPEIRQDSTGNGVPRLSVLHRPHALPDPLHPGAG